MLLGQSVSVTAGTENAGKSFILIEPSVRTIGTDSINWLTVSGGSPPFTGTPAAVVFTDSGGNLAVDQANFSWDDINNRLGIGTAAPSADIHVQGSGNSFPTIFVENISAGTSAGAQFKAGNDLGHAFSIGRDKLNFQYCTFPRYGSFCWTWFYRRIGIFYECG